MDGRPHHFLLPSSPLVVGPWRCLLRQPEDTPPVLLSYWPVHVPSRNCASKRVNCESCLSFSVRKVWPVGGGTRHVGTWGCRRAAAEAALSMASTGSTIQASMRRVSLIRLELRRLLVLTSGWGSCTCLFQQRCDW